MDGFCRGCLIKYYDPAELVQYTEKNRRLFVYCTGLQVKRNDMFTFQLCKDCFLNMKTSSKFKKLCRTSDRRFKNYLALKNAGDTIDFLTFIKNNDDSLTFRLPLMNGSSTPGYQKCRDDDNESTCTSIRNFMTDILQGEEMPDTEARIIREVIEEEADVLDDSLDSHWLQDDVSIDTDFRLDFSFSPFASPQSVKSDRCFTPHKVTSENGECKNSFCPDLKPKKKHVYTNITGSVDSVDNQSENDYLLPNELNNVSVVKSDEKCDKNDLMPLVQNFYVPIEELEPINASFEIQGKSTDNVKKDVIDTNLEQALKNEHNKKISLEDILLTPPVYHAGSAALTPTINDILFGENLGSPAKSDNHKYHQVDGDINILETLLQTSDKENDTVDINNKDDMDKIDHLNDIQDNYDNMSLVTMLDNVGDAFDTPEDKYDFEKKLCKLCDKKFTTKIGLQTHFQKVHNLEIWKKKVYKTHLCSACGKVFNNRFNYNRHLNTHKKLEASTRQEIHKCDICPMECTSKSKLNVHIGKYHHKEYHIKDTGKLYVCSICGATFNVSSNYYVHKRRHEKLYSLECDHCGKGFYRKEDLVVHIRAHTGERPFRCKLCPRQFSRRDTLNKHIRQHNKAANPNLFKCQFCKTSLPTTQKLNLHMRKSKKCLNVQARLLEEANNDAIVNVAYKTGGNDTITSQPPMIDTETTDGPIECEYCKKSFGKMLNLRLHMKKSHKCQKLRAYLLKASKNNLETVSVDVKSVMFECQYCKKMFLKKQQLYHHKKTSRKCLKMQAQLVETAINDSETVAFNNDSGDIATVIDQIPSIDTEMGNLKSTQYKNIKSG